MLINYVGKPLIISSLLPDNGLASLAGSLTANGHEPLILDYATVDTFKRLFPHKHKDNLQELIKKITIDVDKGLEPDPDDIKALQSLDKEIDGIRKQKAKDLAHGEISDYINKFNPDFIGFKLWLGESFEDSVIIANEIRKQNKKLPIFAGGPQIDWFKELIYKATNVFDALAYGEGEQTILDLVEHVKDGRKLETIPNLIFKRNGDIIRNPIQRIEDMDAMAFPLYDEEIYPVMQGNNKIKMIMFDESRGCPNLCNFCIHPIKSGNKWRTKSAEKIVEQMEAMSEKYGVNVFRLSGSNTPPSLKRKLAKKILEKGIEVVYSGFGHVRDANAEEYRLIRESGCLSLFFGVESGSQYILDKSINKKVKVKNIIKAFDYCKQADIFSIASLIFPAPLETDATAKEGLDALLKMKPDSAIVSMPGVVLGAEWGKNPGKYNIGLPSPESLGLELMGYKAKFTHPPALWDPLPYTINGKTFPEFAKESNKFTLALENQGILTQITDEMYVMSLYSWMPPREFRDKNRSYIFSGDYEKLGALVKTINQNLKDGIRV